MIPKRIIYAWFGNKSYPHHLQEYKENWKKLNPDYDFLEINENNFDIDYCKFTREAYDSGNMAFVSDVARVWAVNKYGGIYLDVDVELLKSLDFLLNNSQFWAEEEPGMVASGLIFGSESNDELLNEILLFYRKLDLDSYRHIEQISTVHIISTILKKYGLKISLGNQYLSNGAVVYQSKYFAPLHYWGGGKITPQTVAVHHYNGSWLTSNNKSYLRYLAHEVGFYCPFLGMYMRWLKRKMQS